MNKKSLFEDDEYMTLDPNMKVHPNPAPRKMALAKAMLEKMAIVQENRRKQPQLTSAQMALLNRYTHQPNEKQMKKLEVFLFYLFIDDDYILEPKKINSLPRTELVLKREQLSLLQNKLLYAYECEPNEEQMQKLQDFLFQLLGNEPIKSEQRQELMVA